MKSVALATLFSGLLCAQQPSPTVQPQAGVPAVGAPQGGTPQSAPAASEVKPDTVVMEANGRKYTAAEVDKLIALLPPQYQQQARLRPQMLSTILVYQKLAEDATKEKLDQSSPYKEQIEFSRVQLLAQAELTLHGNSIQVSADDQQKYYKDHPEKFQEAKVRVIYVAFNPAPGKTGADGKSLPSEAESKTKIEGLRQQIAAGADFGKIARDNSDDKASAAKDGDFGVIKHNSAYPEPIKTAVFALKPGEMSQPIRLPNGFYLVRLEELNSQPYDEVNPQIIQEIRQERFQAWAKELQSQYDIKVENASYFTPKPPPAHLEQVR